MKSHLEGKTSQQNLRPAGNAQDPSNLAFEGTTYFKDKPSQLLGRTGTWD